MISFSNQLFQNIPQITSYSLTKFPVQESSCIDKRIIIFTSTPHRLRGASDHHRKMQNFFRAPKTTRMMKTSIASHGIRIVSIVGDRLEPYRKAKVFSYNSHPSAYKFLDLLSVTCCYHAAWAELQTKRKSII